MLLKPRENILFVGIYSSHKLILRSALQGEEYHLYVHEEVEYELELHLICEKRSSLKLFAIISF